MNNTGKQLTWVWVGQLCHGIVGEPCSTAAKDYQSACSYHGLKSKKKEAHVGSKQGKGAKQKERGEALLLSLVPKASAP